MKEEGDIERVLNVLKEQRTVFHSEADFKFAFALKFKELFPNFELRLEKREIIDDTEIYLDLFAFNSNKEAIAIEFKYISQT